MHRYEKLIPTLTNDEKDRHVLAAAIKGRAAVIVTSNLKDFPNESLREWNIKAQHPEEFLLSQYRYEPQIVVSKLNQQAVEIGRDLPGLLRTLRKSVPAFAKTVAAKLDIEIPPDDRSSPQVIHRR